MIVHGRFFLSLAIFALRGESVQIQTNACRARWIGVLSLEAGTSDFGVSSCQLEGHCRSIQGRYLQELESGIVLHLLPRGLDGEASGLTFYTIPATIHKHHTDAKLVRAYRDTCCHRSQDVEERWPK